MELSFVLLAAFLFFAETSSMLTSLDDWLASVNSNQKNYGIAVLDVGNDGKFEMMVGGYNGANLVLQYDEANKKLKNIVTEEPYKPLMDEQGQTLGLSACDIDGDGIEEIYVLNSGSYSGRSNYGDKIFKWRDGKYVDLYNDKENADLDARNFAGRSVACVDRFGSGKYGFVLATYSDRGAGAFALIEMDEKKSDVSAGKVVLKNSASEAGIAKSTGGRGIVVGPILQDDGKLDIFFDNEGNGRMGNKGENFLFKNIGNGKYEDIARDAGVADGNEAGRGVALADFNADGLLDIVYGNWMGKHRLFIQEKNSNGARSFKDVATPEMAQPSSIRTVMAVDFDNDGHLEVLYNNINSYGQSPNRLFRVESNGAGKPVSISKLDIGDALEMDGYGTGGAYFDFDQDGFLEVMLSHGESGTQPLTLYTVRDELRGRNRNWIRVFPRSKYGAPARGATVSLTTEAGLEILRVIDSGSGYLCQMEPIAHFGLDQDDGKKIRVQWPDGKTLEKELSAEDQRTLIKVDYPESGAAQSRLTGSNE